MKKLLKYLIILISILALAFAAYVVYVFTAYYRLPDRLSLEIMQNSGAGEAAENKYSYSIMTYNIGFGAYRRDYSFFMDGGKSSWAESPESVNEAVCGAGKFIKNEEPDFVLLQEVDRDGTRSYHINELELMNPYFEDYYYTYAQNYDSPFLFFPPWEPHGANEAGIVTYSKMQITEAQRRSLPISESFSRLVDLDRCYSISRIPLKDGRMLCIYNIHMSAYGSSDEIRAGQLAMLYEDMEADYAEGNYVVCGGDFNHDLKPGAPENVPEWACPFPRESLPEGFRMAIDDVGETEDTAHNTCRSSEEPYQEGTTYTVTLDGFIISGNVIVESYRHLNSGYEYSDHDPVFMEFRLED